MISQSRVIVENVHPQLEGGLHPIKSITGEYIPVSATVIGDGHDIIACSIMSKHQSERKWQENRMQQGDNDSWSSSFETAKQGMYEYKITAWVDHALNWQHGIVRKIDDGQHVNSELLEGADYLEEVKKNANKTEAAYLDQLIVAFKDESHYDFAAGEAVSEKLYQLLYKYPIKTLVNESKTYQAYTDREKARFSTWYEFFPRSAAKEEGKHGTFKDCEALLPRVAKMGFDVLYFPPVHPIGRVNRKGKNNSTQAKEGDVGSPWGIGAEEGGHKSLHPELGTEADFKSLVDKAKEMGIEIAMDFALQAAPDHPWVKSNPEWFKWRPDGTVQYAENPPKKYQDILPIYFESKDWKNLWDEMLACALYWVEEFGIRIFRVDNPHTKPYYFWGWLMAEVKKKYPDVLFLSEAFTRPSVMHQLAKQGFTQSYTYYTWRNTKQELIEYMEEVTKTDQKYFFRPNFWPNTPDINPWHLQGGNEAIHLIRYFMAATLSSNTGLYGPVYEYMVSDAVPGKEEYWDSEKYQLRHWNWEAENKITTLISKINHIRKENSSLQQTNNIQFLGVENDQLLAYYKADASGENETLMVVNLDPHYPQSGWVELPLEAMGINEGHPVTVIDQITDSSYIWDKAWNFVELHPALPFHLFKISK